MTAGAIVFLILAGAVLFGGLFWALGIATKSSKK
ncbi:MetS family NSS transporter small subunit [Thermosipho ferrireducens]|uniref:MetS family NSS transporter small subunit n=1 Tax=Thermosipho ferrireducens TaxID=2571116 RepID=A0ABX7S4Q0_9BACT|nr:MetS family NSS transporter small subunit [Thermosipho ferrireducens]QTA37453.1 MetS family NSS transporter small subunit [Thermosipho ferrireducens]